MTPPEANTRALSCEEASPRTSHAGSRQTIPSLSVIIPCHNEEPVLPQTARHLCDRLDALARDGLVVEPQVYFIDDGSTDDTWAVIESLAGQDARIHGLKLSRNFGQQNAILAGLLTAPGDILISIDADLQDDVAAIDEMVRAYQGGAEVVYGIRSDRKTDGFFKRTTAEWYYRLLRAMGVQIVFNHADFRLLGRRVVEELRHCNESNLLLRGLVPQLGFRSACVYYERQMRRAGETKYSVSKMLSLAITGITSFSEIPLKIITVIGLLVSLFSFGLGFWALFARLFLSTVVPGWASIVIPMYMLGGIQLLSLGVIGQYLAKIYSETKARPRFIIDKTL